MRRSYYLHLRDYEDYSKETQSKKLIPMTTSNLHHHAYPQEKHHFPQTQRHYLQDQDLKHHSNYLKELKGPQTSRYRESEPPSCYYPNPQFEFQPAHEKQEELYFDKEKEMRDIDMYKMMKYGYKRSKEFRKLEREEGLHIYDPATNSLQIKDPTFFQDPSDHKIHSQTTKHQTEGERTKTLSQIPVENTIKFCEVRPMTARNHSAQREIISQSISKGNCSNTNTQRGRDLLKKPNPKPENANKLRYIPRPITSSHTKQPVISQKAMTQIHNLKKQYITTIPQSKNPIPKNSDKGNANYTERPPHSQKFKQSKDGLKEHNLYSEENDLILPPREVQFNQKLYNDKILTHKQKTQFLQDFNSKPPSCHPSYPQTTKHAHIYTKSKCDFEEPVFRQAISANSTNLQEYFHSQKSSIHENINKNAWQKENEAKYELYENEWKRGSHVNINDAERKLTMHVQELTDQIMKKMVKGSKYLANAIPDRDTVKQLQKATSYTTLASNANGNVGVSREQALSAKKTGAGKAKSKPRFIIPKPNNSNTKSKQSENQNERKTENEDETENEKENEKEKENVRKIEKTKNKDKKKKKQKEKEKKMKAKKQNKGKEKSEDQEKAGQGKQNYEDFHINYYNLKESDAPGVGVTGNDANASETGFQTISSSSVPSNNTTTVHNLKTVSYPVQYIPNPSYDGPSSNPYSIPSATNKSNTPPPQQLRSLQRDLTSNCHASSTARISNNTTRCASANKFIQNYQNVDYYLVQKHSRTKAKIELLRQEQAMKEISELQSKPSLSANTHRIISMKPNEGKSRFHQTLQKCDDQWVNSKRSEVDKTQGNTYKPKINSRSKTLPRSREHLFLWDKVRKDKVKMEAYENKKEEEKNLKKKFTCKGSQNILNQNKDKPIQIEERLIRQGLQQKLKLQMRKNEEDSRILQMANSVKSINSSRLSTKRLSTLGQSQMEISNLGGEHTKPCTILKLLKEEGRSTPTLTLAEENPLFHTLQGSHYTLPKPKLSNPRFSEHHTHAKNPPSTTPAKFASTTIYTRKTPKLTNSRNSKVSCLPKGSQTERNASKSSYSKNMGQNYCKNKQMNAGRPLSAHRQRASLNELSNGGNACNCRDRNMKEPQLTNTIRNKSHKIDPNLVQLKKFLDVHHKFSRFLVQGAGNLNSRDNHDDVASQNYFGLQNNGCVQDDNIDQTHLTGIQGDEMNGEMLPLAGINQSEIQPPTEINQTSQPSEIHDINKINGLASDTFTTESLRNRTNLSFIHEDDPLSPGKKSVKQGYDEKEQKTQNANVLRISEKKLKELRSSPNCLPQLFNNVDKMKVFAQEAKIQRDNLKVKIATSSEKVSVKNKFVFPKQYKKSAEFFKTEDDNDVRAILEKYKSPKFADFQDNDQSPLNTADGNEGIERELTNDSHQSSLSKVESPMNRHLVSISPSLSSDQKIPNTKTFSSPIGNYYHNIDYLSFLHGSHRSKSNKRHHRYLSQELESESYLCKPLENEFKKSEEMKTVEQPNENQQSFNQGNESLSYSIHSSPNQKEKLTGEEENNDSESDDNEQQFFHKMSQFELKMAEYLAKKHIRMPQETFPFSTFETRTSSKPTPARSPLTERIALENEDLPSQQTHHPSGETEHETPDSKGELKYIDYDTRHFITQSHKLNLTRADREVLKQKIEDYHCTRTQKDTAQTMPISPHHQPIHSAIKPSSTAYSPHNHFTHLNQLHNLSNTHSHADIEPEPQILQTQQQQCMIQKDNHFGLLSRKPLQSTNHHNQYNQFNQYNEFNEQNGLNGDNGFYENMRTGRPEKEVYQTQQEYCNSAFKSTLPIEGGRESEAMYFNPLSTLDLPHYSNN